jgi:hypothetical protein
MAAGQLLMIPRERAPSHREINKQPTTCVSATQRPPQPNLQHLLYLPSTLIPAPEELRRRHQRTRL